MLIIQITLLTFRVGYICLTPICQHVYIVYFYLLYIEPSAAPAELSLVEKSLTSLTVKWNRIPVGQIPGMLLGYKLKYKKVISGDYHYQDVDGWQNTQATITDLEKSTTYIIHVAGYTQSGTGPYSEGIIEITEIGKY